MKVRELQAKEMTGIVGGAITAAFINAIAKAISTIFNLGKETGSALRRLTSGSYCKTN